MQLTRLALSNFRNYAQLDLDPAPGLNMFVGSNAQGKSNLLEAIAMLGTGKSFRTSRDADLVREGLELAVVGGDAQVRAGIVHLGCTIVRTGNRTRKTYTINGAGVRYARFLGSIRVVTFVPADLQLGRRTAGATARADQYRARAGRPPLLPRAGPLRQSAAAKERDAARHGRSR